MAFFSFGSDKYGKRKVPSNPVSGKPGTFGGPVQFRAPGTPYKASDLEITPNPYGPKRTEPDSKYLRHGGVTIGLKGSQPVATATRPSAPSGFNYSQVSAPKSPATVNTAAVAPAPAPGGGFSAAPGSGIAARVAAMGKAAGGQPVQAANVPSSPASIGAASVQPQIPNDVIRRTAEQNLQKYRQGVLNAMSPSEQERALADELAQFQGQARLGISGLEGQGRGIPLGLIRGQQAQLQEQAGIQEQTILGRLQAAQQARQAELAASQAALGFEEADIAREEARANAQAAGIKPIEIGGSLVALNPSTGQYEVVYQAPPSSDAMKPLGVSPGETIIDPTTGQVIYQAPFKPEDAPSAPATVQEYQFAQSQGFQGSFLDYQKAKDAATASVKPPTAEQSKAAGFAARITEANKTIDELADQFTGLTSQLGFVPEYLRSENRKLMEQAQRNFINAVLRRESGAAISESEFENARSQYFPQPGDTAAVLAQKKQNRDTVLGSLQSESRGQLPGGGDDIDSFLDSLPFSSAPSTAVKGSLQSFKSAIAKQESGARYNAVGPKTSKGNQAYGKYQVMDFNVPSWTKEALGKSLTPQQFLNDPQAQEAVADYKFQKLYDQYGNWQDVASVWFSGRPLARAGNASDVTGTTVPRYVANITKFMSQG